MLAEHPVYALLHDGKAERVVPVIRSDVTRTSWQVDRKNGRLQLDLDDGTISAGERSRAFAELELELLEGAPSSLVVAARRLSDHVPVRLGVLTKAERGFMLANGTLGKIAKAAPVAVESGMTVGEAIEVIVHACLKHYRLNEPLVIRKCKAEALSQARVAMRRLRSAFTLFRPAVEDVEYQHLRHEVRWFTAQLGDARNIDVYLTRDLDDDERERLLAKRERAYEHVADAMNSHKFRRLLIDIVGWTAIGAWRSAKPACRSIDGFATRRLDKLWRSIATAGRRVADMDESTRHGLRIQVKKMRYAIEFLCGLFPGAKGPQRAFGDTIEELQEVLGKLNDLATAKSFESQRPHDDWLIGSYEERRYLKSAEDAYRKLLEIGPYWRDRASRC
jgi:inorganic triphosphatase YgiF